MTPRPCPSPIRSTPSIGPPVFAFAATFVVIVSRSPSRVTVCAAPFSIAPVVIGKKYALSILAPAGNGTAMRIVPLLAAYVAPASSGLGIA